MNKYLLNMLDTKRRKSERKTEKFWIGIREKNKKNSGKYECRIWWDAILTNREKKNAQRENFAWIIANFNFPQADWKNRKRLVKLFNQKSNFIRASMRSCVRRSLDRIGESVGTERIVDARLGQLHDWFARGIIYGNVIISIQYRPWQEEMSKEPRCVRETAKARFELQMRSDGKSPSSRSYINMREGKFERWKVVQSRQLSYAKMRRKLIFAARKVDRQILVTRTTFPHSRRSELEGRKVAATSIYLLVTCIFN